VFRLVAKMFCNMPILHSRIIVFIVAHFVCPLCVCDAGDKRSFVVSLLISCVLRQFFCVYVLCFTCKWSKKG